jgi:hypothetical protein
MRTMSDEKRQTLFVVSDVHGHYTEMMAALAQAGFDRDCKEHIFVSCGDLFDRGFENGQVYAFVTSLERRILIRGNHEDFLRDVLERGSLLNMDVANGTDVTVEQLVGEKALDARGNLDRESCAAEIREVVAFLDSMVHYHESGEYIFTHGWLPTVFEERSPRVDPDWRNASASEWRLAHRSEWQQFYGAGATLEGRSIVCGHRPSYMGYYFDSTRERDCTEIFFGKGMIALDANTVRSGRVNVLVVTPS